jgi:hypothetical protein
MKPGTGLMLEFIYVICEKIQILLNIRSPGIRFGLGYQDSANQKQDFPVAAMLVIRLR